jgi:hypothetical protein
MTRPGAVVSAGDPSFWKDPHLDIRSTAYRMSAFVLVSE